MKNKLIGVSTIVTALLIVAVVIGVTVSKQANGGTEVVDDKDVERIGEFAGSTMELVLNEEKNMCYSPVSLYMSLCGTAELTSSEASSKVLDALGYRDLEEMEKSYNNIVEKVSGIDSNGGVILAGSIWIPLDEETDENKDFINEIEKCLDKDIFAKNINNEAVNQWITDKTNGKIKELKYTPDDEVRVRLADVVYFEGLWCEEFTVNKENIFRISEDETVEAMYMIGEKEELEAMVGENYTAVRKPYIDGSGMIFIKANKGKIKDVITSENITSLLEDFYSGKAEKREVELTVPRFEIKGGIEQNTMEEVFQGLGVEDLLEEKSWDRFMESDEGIPLYLYQDANISVYEKGTLGEAVTVINWVDYGKDETLEMYLNEPFMYIVEKNGIPLFIGTVYNPTEG